jgi:hypothetical protein
VQPVVNSLVEESHDFSISELEEYYSNAFSMTNLSSLNLSSAVSFSSEPLLKDSVATGPNEIEQSSPCAQYQAFNCVSRLLGTLQAVHITWRLLSVPTASTARMK